MHPAHEDADLHTFLGAGPVVQAAWLAARDLPPATLLPLLNACAQRCFFCAGPGTTDLPDAARTPDGAIRAHLAARPPGVDRLLVGGNEPTLHPAFEAVLGSARALGYPRVDLMTNGATLRGNAARWAAAGLREVVVPLYALDAATHDAICGVPCHDAVVAGLDEAHAAGIRVRLHTLLLRRTLADLPALATWVHARYGERLAVGLLREKPVFDWATAAPTLGAIRAALAAVPAADRPLLLQAPRCLEWSADHDGIAPTDTRRDPDVIAPALLATLYFSSQARSFPTACAGCVERDRCPGVVTAYGAGASGAGASGAGA
ncbi:MAG: radical SAM protein [Pseudomonadota bacterium]|nr:radical SAM protein [Pseudomonadota bacterium]